MDWLRKRWDWLRKRWDDVRWFFTGRLKVTTRTCTEAPCNGSHGPTCCVCRRTLTPLHYHMRIEGRPQRQGFVRAGVACDGTCLDRFIGWASRLPRLASWLCPEDEWREQQRRDMAARSMR